MVERVSAALRRLKNASTANYFRIPAVNVITEEPDGIIGQRANILVTLVDNTEAFLRVRDVVNCRRARKKMRRMAREKGTVVQEVIVPLKEDFKFLLKRVAECLRALYNRARRIANQYSHEFTDEFDNGALLTMPSIQMRQNRLGFVR